MYREQHSIQDTTKIHHQKAYSAKSWCNKSNKTKTFFFLNKMFQLQFKSNNKKATVVKQSTA